MVLRKGWEPTPLGDLLTRSDKAVNINPLETYKQVTVKLWGLGVILRDIVSGSEISAAKRYEAKPGQFILSKIDARNGAFGLVPLDLDGAVVSGDFPVFDINPDRLEPKYLEWKSKTKEFVGLCRVASEGTTNRVRLKEDKFLRLKFLLPPLPEQQRIVAKIEALAVKIAEAKVQRSSASQLAASLIKSGIKEVVETDKVTGRLGAVLRGKPRNGWSARCDNSENGTPILSLGAVTGFNYRQTEFKRTSLDSPPEAHFWLEEGDLLITRSNTPDLVGHAAIYNGTPSPCIYPDLIMRVDVDDSYADRRFVWYWLQSPVVREFIGKEAKGTSPTMKKISQGTVMQIPFPQGLPLTHLRQLVNFLRQKLA